MTYFKYFIATTFILAIVCVFISFFMTNILYHATRTMNPPEHKLLKQIILRFTNCKRLNIPICNTSVFVHHYIFDYSKSGLHYRTFGILGNIFAIAGVILTILGLFHYKESFYSYTMNCILYVCLFILCSGLWNSERVISKCIVGITDYLDNTLNHRIIAAETAKVSMEPAESVPTATISATAQSSDKTKVSEEINNSKNDDIIFSVINDFLV